ncbi:MAG: four helix bundle protein [Saprospiraceae bacterium]
MEKQKIFSYTDLEVYQRSYATCLIVMQQIIPKLPQSEKFDLTDQLSRSSKSIPRLIAEGYAKKTSKSRL